MKIKLEKKTVLEIFLKWAKRKNKHNDTLFRIRMIDEVLLIEKMGKINKLIKP